MFAISKLKMPYFLSPQCGGLTDTVQVHLEFKYNNTKKYFKMIHHDKKQTAKGGGNSGVK